MSRDAGTYLSGRVDLGAVPDTIRLLCLNSEGSYCPGACGLRVKPKLSLQKSTSPGPVNGKTQQAISLEKKPDSFTTRRNTSRAARDIDVDVVANDFDVDVVFTWVDTPDEKAFAET